MELELFLFGGKTQRYCGEILRKIPRILVKNKQQNCGEFIILRRSEPVEYWCIFDSRQEQVMQMVEHYHLRTLSCGFSSYDTLVLSGCEAQSTAVSLQREIRNVLGEVIEPGDYLIHNGSCIPEEFLMLSTGSLLLIGWQEREFFF